MSGANRTVIGKIESCLLEDAHALKMPKMVEAKHWFCGLNRRSLFTLPVSNSTVAVALCCLHHQKCAQIYRESLLHPCARLNSMKPWKLAFLCTQIISYRIHFTMAYGSRSPAINSIVLFRSPSHPNSRTLPDLVLNVILPGIPTAQSLTIHPGHEQTQPNPTVGQVPPVHSVSQVVFSPNAYCLPLTGHLGGGGALGIVSE